MTIKKRVPMPWVRFAALIFTFFFSRFSEYRIPQRSVRRALRLYRLRAHHRRHTRRSTGRVRRGPPRAAYLRDALVRLP
jgi:hypothetical protein